MPPIFNLFTRKQGTYKDDTLSGLTVALALVPEAIAFSFLAGVSPMVGLWSAVFVGFITATMGGRPGMISGATGALAVVMVSLVALPPRFPLEPVSVGYLAGLRRSDRQFPNHSCTICRHGGFFCRNPCNADDLA